MGNAVRDCFFIIRRCLELRTAFLKSTWGAKISDFVCFVRAVAEGQLEQQCTGSLCTISNYICLLKPFNAQVKSLFARLSSLRLALSRNLCCVSKLSLVYIF